MTALVLALARAWVSLYTRGLPAELRDRRREEIASDLWEQRHDERSRRPSLAGVDVLGRVVRGVPADLSWRLEQRARRSAAQRIRLAGAVARRHGWTAFPVLVALGYATGAAKLGTPDSVDLPEQVAMAFAAVAVLCGVAGLWRGTAPVAAAWLVCIGALAPLPLIVSAAPLSLMWALLAMRSAVNRSEALRAVPPLLSA
jgi:hypothetical protein